MKVPFIKGFGKIVINISKQERVKIIINIQLKVL